MNTFAVYTDVLFIEKTGWLEEFKNKHNQIKYDDHVTLIQPRRVTEREIDEIKIILTSFFKDQTCKQISLTFDRIDVDETGVEENDGCILVLTDNQHVIDLQKALIGLLSGYKEYLTPKTEVYEKDFRPHITIVDNLNKERFQLAKADLKTNVVIRGIITKVILGVVCNGEKQEFVFGLQV